MFSKKYIVTALLSRANHGATSILLHTVAA